MIQQGQVFKLKTKGPDGQPLRAYRYRLEGRGSERPQVGGFATRAEAEKALRKVPDRLGPGGGRVTITLAEFVDEYLELHQAAPVTITKLRWLLCKATAKLGEKRLADLSPRDAYAWRLTVPAGHRFEATQALRQVLNRAVAWGLLDSNPAKRGVLLEPWTPMAAEGYPTERLSVLIWSDGRIAAIPRRARGRRWLHRYPDPLGQLCLWDPNDPPALRWHWSDGLAAFITIAHRHPQAEEYWRRTGTWPAEDAPHGEGTHPIRTPALRAATFWRRP